METSKGGTEDQQEHPMVDWLVPLIGGGFFQVPENSIV